MSIKQTILITPTMVQSSWVHQDLKLELFMTLAPIGLWLKQAHVALALAITTTNQLPLSRNKLLHASLKDFMDQLHSQD